MFSLGSDKEGPQLQVAKTRVAPLVILAVLLSAFLFSLGLLGHLGSKMTRQLAPLVDASMEIKYDASLFHLWFEEYVQGDRTIDEKAVWSYLNESAWYANAMLHGGRNHEGTFIPLHDKRLQVSIRKLLGKIEVLRKAGQLRLFDVQKGATGSRLDQAFDASFMSLLQQAEEMESYLQQAIADEMAWYDLISTTLMAAFIIFSLLSIAGFIYFERLRQRDVVRQISMMEQINHSKKMEAIGILVGGVAHDFNNALAGITGNLYLAKGKACHDPELSDKLETAEQLSFKVADTIKKLLTFAQKETMRFSRFSLAEHVRETLKLVRQNLPANVVLSLYVAHDPLSIQGDKLLIQQVLKSLLDNAIDAVEHTEKPRIDVRLEPFHPDEAFADQHAGPTADRYAQIQVEDNGCGIDEGDVPHLFEPFFTTKEPDKGTGMGLAMAYGAVHSHGGYIDYEKGREQGSVFHVYIPLVRGTWSA